MAYTTINKPSDYFNTVTYTGDGTTNQTKAITFGFKPDLAWFKARDAGQSHIWVDSVRGGTKYLVSEATNAEGTLGVAQLFTSTGMTVSNDASANSLNSSGSTKVSWGWVASNTTAVSNTAGTISSTVSANTTAGFSIVSYTGNGTSGATVGHGLGVTPACYLVKCRNTGGSNWSMYHQSLGNTKAMVFTATAERTSAVYWNNTSPTTTVFSLGNDHDVNVNTQTYVAYCFAEIKGYSKFGTYTGNGSADGTFIYTGFKPAFVIVKSNANAYPWVMHDSKRPAYNPENYLYTHSSNAEASDIPHDFLSNGFKIRGTYSDTNGSGANYIYMAFAEQPLVGTNNVPATAR